MKGSTKDFFNQESTRYEQFVKGRDFVLSLKEKVNPLLKGRVLDVGSGCIADFKDGFFDLYIGLDLSLGMLLGLPREEKIKPVCGDAMGLPFQDGSMDVVIYRAILHHLNPGGKAPHEMEGVVRLAFSEARRVVRKDGQILVIEPCLPPLLVGFERWFGFFIRFVMRCLNLPYVFIFSRDSLSKLLGRGGWIFLKTDHIEGTGRAWEWIQPILGLPFIKIPRWTSPSKTYLFQGRK